ncbi:cupin [Solibacillus sp. CAU 1738]|uniref:cupin n=1 Tax=Solibacillus sp. CAU 1738 TaxID=3140363 RepID=UPI00325FED63
MKFYKFASTKGNFVTHFNSHFFMNKIIQTNSEAQIALMTLEENGVVGYHQAVVPQMLVILDGEGYVRSNSSDFTFIKKGEAVLWDKDEWHETKTKTGLIALVIESKEIETNCILMDELFIKM